MGKKSPQGDAVRPAGPAQRVQETGILEVYPKIDVRSPGGGDLKKPSDVKLYEPRQNRPNRSSQQFSERNDFWILGRTSLDKA